MKTIFGSGTFSLKQLMRSGVTNKASQKAFFGNLLSLFMQSGTDKQAIKVPGVPGLRMVVKGQHKAQNTNSTDGPTNRAEQPSVIKSFASFRLAMQTVLDDGGSKTQEESILDSASETVILQGIYSVPAIRQQALSDQLQKQEFQASGVQVKVSIVDNQPLLQIKVAESGELSKVLKYVQNLERKALQNHIALPRIEVDSQEKIPAQILKDFHSLATDGKLLEEGKLIDLPKAGTGEINKTTLVEKSQNPSAEHINNTSSKLPNKTEGSIQTDVSGLKGKAEPAASGSLRNQLRSSAGGVNKSSATLGKIPTDTPAVQHKEVREQAPHTDSDKVRNVVAAAKKAAPKIAENRMVGHSGLKSEQVRNLHTQLSSAKVKQEFQKNAFAQGKSNSAKHNTKTDNFMSADKPELQLRTARNTNGPLQSGLKPEKSANPLQKNNTTVAEQVTIDSKPSLSQLEAALNGRTSRMTRMMRSGQFTQTMSEEMHTETVPQVKTAGAKSTGATGNVQATAERITTAQTASAIGMVTNRQEQKKGVNQSRHIESLNQTRGNSEITGSDKPVTAEQAHAGRTEKAIPSGAAHQAQARNGVAGNIEQNTTKVSAQVQATNSELSATSKPETQSGQKELQTSGPDGLASTVKETAHKSRPKAGKEASFSANTNNHSETAAENKAHIHTSEKVAQEPVALNTPVDRQHPANTRPAMLATRVPEIIEQFMKARPRNIGRNTFRIATSPVGNLEINLDVQEKSKQIKIRVASESARDELQKVLPQIQHNLNVKGIEFTALNIEVMPSGQKAGQANEHQTRNQSRSKQKEERKVRDEHENESTVGSKEYGYNTMEVIA